jgi:pimeloyl-ACP methyl ester carboxylesterase
MFSAKRQEVGMNKHLSSDQWEPSERSGLTRLSDSVEKLIRVPLNGSNRQHGEFDLYYFVHTAAGLPTSNSVLFCAGGPGQIVRPLDRANTYADFLCKYGYNVVFFHLRGTGFSQIPAGNENDKFLRSTFAVADMEAIRRDFLDRGFGGTNMPWEAIVGWSFGTVLGQLYAKRYGPSLVKKLLLISPLSRHMFNNSGNAFDNYYKQMLRIYRTTLDGIYQSPSEPLRNEFGDLENADRKTILEALFDFDDGILRKTEQAFGSIQFVIDAYSEIEADTFDKFKLQKYSRAFYQSLRDLRIVGANAIDDSGIIEHQRLIGKTIRDELLRKRVTQFDEPVEGSNDQGSQRAYYSFGVRDGLNWLFLREYRQRRRGVKDSITAIGGEAKIANRSLKKVKVSNLLEKTPWDKEMKITPWDPAAHDHNVPTLILNGELDPVTAGGQAERYIKTKFRGLRTLIVFPDIGHTISLGTIFGKEEEYKETQPPILSGAIKVELPRIPPKAIVEAKGIAAGVGLNSNLRLDLDKPEGLKDSITVHGCGILDANVCEKSDQGDDLNIVALIENLTEREIQVGSHKWILRTPFLRGTVGFLKPKVIEPKVTCAIFGKLTGGQRARAYDIHPLDPKGIPDGLELIGFSLKDGGSLELWFRNGGNVLPEEVVLPWVIRNLNSRSGNRPGDQPFVDRRFAFRVTIPELKTHEIISRLVAVDGLNFDATEVLTINPPQESAEQLTACFNVKPGPSNKLSFVIWNHGEKSKQINKGWSVSCPIFSASVELESKEIGPNTVETVAADVTGITWVNCLEIKPTSDRNSNLQLLSFNIQDRHLVSMLFKNAGDAPISSPPLDWPYVDPTVDGNDPAIDRAVNCLIFSFIVFSPSQFRNTEDNEVFKRIQERCKPKILPGLPAARFPARNRPPREISTHIKSPL